MPAAIEPLAFSCACGTVHGSLSGRPRKDGLHVCCYCPDCRASELYFNQPDPAPNPVSLYQVSPWQVSISTGTNNLGLMRLGPKGLLRWYATCCNVHLFNTFKSPVVPFVAVPTSRIIQSDQLGKVQAQAFVPLSNGKRGHKGSGRMVWRLAVAFLSSRLTGDWRKTPFFDPETKKPLVQQYVLTREERAALYP